MGDVMFFGYQGWFRFSELQISGDGFFIPCYFLIATGVLLLTASHHTRPSFIKHGENKSWYWKLNLFHLLLEALFPTHRPHPFQAQQQTPVSSKSNGFLVARVTHACAPLGVCLSASLQSLPDNPSLLAHFALIKAFLYSTRWIMPVPYKELIHCQTFFGF